MSAEWRTALTIIDASRYMTLATADGSGSPWASPVWFAHDRYRDFLWVSRPEARHSLNIAARRKVAIVIFDSTAEIGTGQGVYLEASAEQLAGAAREDAMAIFSHRSQAQGGRAWTLRDVEDPAPHRFYRAAVSSHYLLDEGDRRVPLDLSELSG
jgi:uncharacterized protein YhbP (UPF0306 family)